MGILTDMFAPPPPRPARLLDDYEELTSAALQAIARIDAGMAGYVRTMDACAAQAVSNRLSAHATDELRLTWSVAAWRTLSDALLEARKLLDDAVGAR